MQEKDYKPYFHAPANNKNKPAHTIRQQNVYCIAVLVILCMFISVTTALNANDIARKNENLSTNSISPPDLYYIKKASMISNQSHLDISSMQKNGRQSGASQINTISLNFRSTQAIFTTSGQPLKNSWNKSRMPMHMSKAPT